MGRKRGRMVRLGRRPPNWDRFGKWPPGAARMVLFVFALLLVAAALTQRTDIAEPAPPVLSTRPAATTPEVSPEAVVAGEERDADLQLYDAIADRVAAGENYYVAAVEEQRARNFPVRPGLAVRLPTLAYVQAVLGKWGMIALATGVSAMVLGAWWFRLREEPGGERLTIFVLALIAIGILAGAKPAYLALHGVWAGLFLALSFGLHRRGRWVAAWLAAAAAVAVREHALPFVLLMGALAWIRRDWRECASWALLGLLFLGGLWIHLTAVGELISPSDPPSPGWLAFRGLGGLTGNIVASSPLHLLPGWLAAPIALLPMLGWAGWRSDAGVFGFLLCAGYGIFFMIAGRDNNFYWALVVMPVWFVGLAFLPRALTSLWNSARHH